MNVYQLPAPLVQAAIQLLLEMPAGKSFNVLYDLKSFCDQQDAEQAQKDKAGVIQAAVSSALAAQAPSPAATGTVVTSGSPFGPEIA